MKTKEQMINYLVSHKRYYTMNSWNLLTSWAANIKVYNVIPSKYQDKVYELLDTQDYYEEIKLIIEDYLDYYNCPFKVGFNGRSSGYLVMYDYEINNGKLRILSHSVDTFDKEDYEDMLKSEVTQIYNKVYLFDKLVQTIIKQTIYLAVHSEVIEETYQITKTRKVIKQD